MIKRKPLPVNIIKGDNFQMMPVSAKLLFYEMVVYSDDAGFVSNSCSILSKEEASPDNLKMLIAKGFVRVADGGYYVLSEEVYFHE